jgi:hypothetical protein
MLGATQDASRRMPTLPSHAGLRGSATLTLVPTLRGVLPKHKALWDRVQLPLQGHVGAGPCACPNRRCAPTCRRAGTGTRPYEAVPCAAGLTPGPRRPGLGNTPSGVGLPAGRGQAWPEGGTQERPGLARAKSRAHGIPTEGHRDEGALHLCGRPSVAQREKVSHFEAF